MRCVVNVRVSTNADAASAASTSPRTMTDRESRLSWSGCTRGAPGASAASGENTPGSGSYSTRMSLERLAGVPLGVGNHRGQDVADAMRHSPSATNRGQSR